MVNLQLCKTSKDCLDEGEMAEKRGIKFRICHTKETTLIRMDKKNKYNIDARGANLTLHAVPFRWLAHSKNHSLQQEHQHFQQQ